MDFADVMIFRFSLRLRFWSGFRDIHEGKQAQMNVAYIWQTQINLVHSTDHGTWEAVKPVPLKHLEHQVVHVPHGLGDLETRARADNG